MELENIAVKNVLTDDTQVPNLLLDNATSKKSNSWSFIIIISVLCILIMSVELVLSCRNLESHPMNIIQFLIINLVVIPS